MSKSFEKIKARVLRRQGQSVLQIAETLGVSKSTVSMWCRDIVLTDKQISVLHNSMVVGGYSGRMKGAQTHKERRLKIIQKYEKQGISNLRKLNPRELLLMGLGLYCGEGSKTGNRLKFTNSNPNLVKIYIVWLKEAFGVPVSDITCQVMINETHRHRASEVQKRWSQILEIPESQFNKVVFIKSKINKVYENADSHLGTLSLVVRKSSNLQYQILGLIHGLVYNLC